ncbi:MAG: hypothetical protein H6740_01335 [Alphaproteobacteria bacterium]|nr:hypothetical protein [Alphaproteobacteria bacterium]
MKDAPRDDTARPGFADSGGPGQPLDDSGDEFDGNARAHRGRRRGPGDRGGRSSIWTAAAPATRTVTR